MVILEILGNRTPPELHTLLLERSLSRLRRLHELDAPSVLIRMEKRILDSLQEQCHAEKRTGRV